MQGPHAAPTVVWIGLWWRWEAFAVMARAVILTMSIYLGPMIASTLMTLKFIHYKVTYTGEERKLASHKQRSFISLAVSSIVKQSLIEDDPWAAFRNFIVGPVSEEVMKYSPKTYIVCFGRGFTNPNPIWIHYYLNRLFFGESFSLFW